MFGDLKITFEAGISDPSPLIVVANRWKNPIPKEDNQQLQSDGAFSLSGNYQITGVSFEIPPVFLIDAWFTQDECDLILGMWHLREKRRRSLGYWRFLVDDETARIYEEATSLTKTRSSVAGTTIIEKNKGCYYYPRFRCDMNRAPVFGEPTTCGDRAAIFTLKEIGVKI